jgi:acetylornithine/N-succinyldiaminopimelate aminotransferase
VLDVVTAPGFLEHVQRLGILFRQRFSELRDRYPNVIADVRGEGLLMGLQAVGPAGEFVDALRAEKLISISTGDNVVRLLPPLIISEEEAAEAVARIDRAAAQLAKTWTARKAEGAAA